MVGQGYQTRTMSGELLDRRRITQWAGLRAMRLFGLDGLHLQVSFRFDTDMGLSGDPEPDPGDLAELLTATLRLRRLFDRVDVTLGRQMLLNEIDFCQFDGLRLDVRLPWHLGLRLVSGLAVRDRSWLGNDVLELDGVEQGHVPAALIGAGLLFRMSEIRAGLDYLRIVLWEDGWPLDSERLAASASVRLFRRRLGLDGGATFDLAQDSFERVRADLWGRLPWPGEGLRIEAGWLQSRPHFALDSIFNFFSPAPFWQIHAGLRWDRTSSPTSDQAGSVRLSYYHRGYRRGDSERPEAAGEPPSVPGVTVDGIDLDGRMSWGRTGFFWLALGFEDGAAGRRWLAAPGLQWEVWFERLWIEGRAVLVSNDDPLEDRFDALTLGGSAGARWLFGGGQTLVVVAELNGNRVAPLRFRLLAVLDLTFSFGPGGFR